MFEEDMKDESRCPLDVNECGNIRDPSRDCEFTSCDDEEEDGGGLEEMMSSGMPTTMPTFEPSPKTTSAPPDTTTSAAAGAFSDPKGSVALKAGSFVFCNLLAIMHI